MESNLPSSPTSKLSTKNQTKKPYRKLRKEIAYNILCYPLAKIKHMRLDRTAKRSDVHTYTAFYRSPGQIAALIGPVLQYVGENNNPKQLQINVLAGSVGAEAYTLASCLMQHCPDLDFHIHCSDLHQDTIEKSKSAEYTFAEVEGIDVPLQFIEETFERNSDGFKVKQNFNEIDISSNFAI